MLQMGSIGAITAGLLGTGTPPPPVAAAPPTIVINGDDLTGACRELFEEARSYRDEAFRLENQLSAMLTVEQAELLRQFSDASSNGATVNEMWQSAELARHLPGLAPAIRMVWEHIIGVAYQNPGGCCTVDAGFEP